MKGFAEKKILTSFFPSSSIFGISRTPFSGDIPKMIARLLLLSLVSSIPDIPKMIARLLLLSLVSSIPVLSSKAEERLLADLFNNYNPAVRPVIHDNDSVNVTFGLTLSQIIDVHEKNQILVISAWIRQKWMNPLLSWDPEKYNGITGINVAPRMVWLPDIVLYNNADEDKSFGGNLDRLNTRVILHYSGLNKWLAPIILKSKCDIDVKYFPFDTQKCPLKFGSWTYDQGRLNLLNESDTADLGKYSLNSEWQLKSVPATLNEVKYFCCPEIFPDVTYTVIIARRSLFYLCNLIFPMTVIGMLTMLSFMLPAESGERVSLAITLLLAMTVFMLVVADIIPATSDVVPLVGIFFSASMVEMVIMIIVLCYIMRLYHKTPNDPPMPLWMRRYILEWLSYKVGVRPRKAGEFEPGKFVPIKRLFTNGADGKSTDKYEIHQAILRKQCTDSRFLELLLDQSKARSSLLGDSGKDSSVYTRGSETTRLFGKLDLILEKLDSVDEEESIKTEWRIVAMTIDACLLVFFAAVLLCTLLGCFMNSPGYVA